MSTGYFRRSFSGTKTFFVIERFIEGETLRKFLDREPKPPISTVVSIGDALLSAVVELADHGLVHRDIKPENIILDSEGKLWLIDFGIVRMLGVESITPTAAQFGSFTLGYGAPEQVRNQKRLIDERSDLFSVGITLYEALSGSNPHLERQENVMAILEHLQTKTLPDLTIPGDESGEFSRLISAMCSRFPSRRPQTARLALEKHVDRSVLIAALAKALRTGKSGFTESEIKEMFSGGAGGR